MTSERFNFITRDEYNAHTYRVEQKFDDFTDIMLGEFDKVHNKTNQIDARLDSIDVRLGTLSEDMRDVKLYMKNSSKRLASLEEKVSVLDTMNGDIKLIMDKLGLLTDNFNLVMNKLSIAK